MITSVSTDTRSVNSGDLFVALQGERFDAHQFLIQAFEKGAGAAVVSEQGLAAVKQQLPSSCGPFLIVKDTRLALGALGKLWRQRLRIPTVALTGSCGKTSVKEMIAQILSQQGKTLSTKGNLNNDFGVPLTLMRLETDHQYAVIEMGANHAGEIHYSSQIVRPDVALITNAAEAHLEGFGSVLGVANAKGEIYGSLSEEGFALINIDDAHHDIWLNLSRHAQQITFSSDVTRTENPADVQLVSVEKNSCQKDRLTVKTPTSVLTFVLPLLGRHQWSNAVVAVAVAERIGISDANIVSGLESLVPIKGRLFAETLSMGCTLIDDTYNANPHSVRAAVDVLKECGGPRLLVLGMMAEMGDEFEEGHVGIGQYIVTEDPFLQDQRTEHGSLGIIDAVYVIGPGGPYVKKGCSESNDTEVRLFSTNADLLQQLNSVVGDRFETILVKGSRSAAMEQVVEALKAMTPAHVTRSELEAQSQQAALKEGDI